jgi:two-component system cell cycle sensor histidine kinase/response regulator CckA
MTARRTKRSTARLRRGGSADAAAPPEAHEFADGLEAIFWQADPAARLFTYVSGAAERLLGHPSEVWLVEPDFAAGLVYAEDRSAAHGAFARAIEGSVEDVEYRVMTADGRLVWLHNTLRAVTNVEHGVEELRGVILDVTERKRAESRLLTQYAVTRALAEAEQLIAAAPNIIKAMCESLDWVLGELWLTDERGGIMRLVESWQSPAHDLSLFVEKSREMAFSAGVGLPGRVLASGKPTWISDVLTEPNLPRAGTAAEVGLRAACAFPIIVRDRTLGVFEFFGRAVREPDGDMLAMMAATGSQIGQFIERRRAEQAQRVSDARAAAILESALDCIISIDGTGQVVEFNPAAERTFGYSREEALGREMCELIVPEDLRAAHREGIARYLETSEAPIFGKRLELPALRADGSIFPAELTVVRVELPGPPLFTGYVRDLSERVRAEEALRQSEDQYRLLFDANPNPTWVYDLDTLRFLAVNESAVREYGYSREEFLGMTIANIRLEEDVAELRAAVEQVAEGAAHNGTWRHRKRDGTIIEVEVVSHELTFEGARSGIVVAVDVTERKNLEEQLLQAQKMEAVGQLAGGIAHDFNNIALVISGYSGALLDLLPENEKARRSASEIGRAAERATSLTRQLLAFSRRQVLQPEELNLSTVVTGIKPMLERLIGEDINLVTTLPTGLGTIRADPGQLEQVLLNLVLNARDAMPQGGELSIAAAAVDLSEQLARERLDLAPGAYVMLSVSDSGSGMDAATRERIFEPFFTTKEPDKGTGLGLSTVYGIVKQSGGSVWVYSEPGHGTSFKLYFPRYGEADGTSQPRESVSERPTGTETVLLVEDDEQARTLVHMLLERLGYTVLAASNGGEALALCDRHAGPIALLVTDVVMPGMSGRALADAVVERRPDTRVLFTSGYSDDMLGHLGIEQGVAYLQKPYDESDLARKAREALGH